MMRALVLLLLATEACSWICNSFVLGRNTLQPTFVSVGIGIKWDKTRTLSAASPRMSSPVVPGPATMPSPRTEKDGQRSCLLYNTPGLVDYPAALQFQKDLQKERIDHKVEHKGKPPFSLPDALILVEHPEVYTLGSSSEASHILFPMDQSQVSEVGGSITVEEDGPDGARFQVHRVQRGGKVTYHCPGQLVGYPIVDLARHAQDIDWYLRTIEQVLIDVLAEYEVEAGIIDGLTGVWVDGKKIAAVGVGASRWVTLHGWALNVDNDMQGFKRIVPCGISDRPVCSLRDFLGDDCPSVSEVRDRIAAKFMAAFDLSPAPMPPPLALSPPS